MYIYINIYSINDHKAMIEHIQRTLGCQYGIPECRAFITVVEI